MKTTTTNSDRVVSKGDENSKSSQVLTRKLWMNLTVLIVEFCKWTKSGEKCTEQIPVPEV